MIDEETADEKTTVEETEETQTAIQKEQPEDKPMSPEEIAAMVTAATQAARAEWEADRESARRELESKPETKVAVRLDKYLDEYGQIVDKAGFTTEMQAMMAETAQAAALQVRADLDPELRPMRASQIAASLGEGLGEKGKEYVAKYAALLGPEEAKNPVVKDLVTRAAKQYESEHAVIRSRTERTQDEQPNISDDDRQAADMFARIAAEKAGVPLDKLRLSDEEMRTDPLEQYR